MGKKNRQNRSQRKRKGPKERPSSRSSAARNKPAATAELIDDRRSKLTRRLVLIGVAVGGAALYGGRVLTSRSELGDVIAAREADEFGWNVDEATLDIIAESVEKLKTMPTTELTTRKVNFKKPDGLELSDEEFVEASSNLGDSVKQLILKELQPKLESLTGKEREAAIEACIGDIIGIAKENPAFRKLLEEKETEIATDPRQRIDGTIKSLFPAGGFSLSIQRMPTYDPVTRMASSERELSYYPVEDTETVDFTDEIGTFEAPVVRLGQALFRSHEVSRLGYYDPETELTFMHNDRVGKSASQRYAEIQADPSQMLEGQEMDIERMKEMIERDTIIHEATHAYVGARFPRICQANSMRFQLKVQGLDVEISPGIRAKLDGIYHPTNFQELCATGVEIYNSADDFPLAYIIYMGTAKSFDTPLNVYQLFGKALPVLTTKLAPNGKRKKETIRDIKTTGGRNMTALNLGMIKHDFDANAVRRVGKALYLMGLKLLKDAESGKMPRVEVPIAK